MTTQVVEALGEESLTLPAQIEIGLAANDRLKYYFTLLQVARSHADQPDRTASSLKQERLAAGIVDGTLDQLVAAAHKVGLSYRVPGCPPVNGRYRRGCASHGCPRRCRC